MEKDAGDISYVVSNYFRGNPHAHPVITKMQEGPLE